MVRGKRMKWAIACVAGVTLLGNSAASWARIDPFNPTAKTSTTSTKTTAATPAPKPAATPAPAPAVKPAPAPLQAPSLSQLLPPLRGLSISAKLASIQQAIAARLAAVKGPATPTTPAVTPIVSPGVTPIVTPVATPAPGGVPVIVVPVEGVGTRQPLISPHR